MTLNKVTLEIEDAVQQRHPLPGFVDSYLRSPVLKKGVGDKCFLFSFVTDPFFFLFLLGMPASYCC